MRIWIILRIIQMLANNIIEDGYNNQHENLFSAWRPFWAPAADEEEEETVRSVGTWRELYLQIFLIFLIFFNVFFFKFFSIFKISRHLKRLKFANILNISDIFNISLNASYFQIVWGGHAFSERIKRNFYSSSFSF